MKFMREGLTRMTTKMIIGAAALSLVILTAGSGTAFAEAQMDRLRCQVDFFINDFDEPDTQVQIQVKVDTDTDTAADMLDVWVVNPATGQTSPVFVDMMPVGGTVSVDWDSSPDLLPDGSIPEGVILIDKFFVVDGDGIVAHARYSLTGVEIPSREAPCDLKVSSQFTQQTKGIPVISIISPAFGSEFSSSEAVTFAGSASDKEDGDITASIIWTSNLDGEIGRGGSFSVILSEGTHTVKAEVTDSSGKAANLSISITVNAPQGTAYFLTVNKTGSGTVASSPLGIDCGASCTKLYNEGTLVTLTATPGAGSVFTGWSGVCTGTASCILTMDAAMSVTAAFVNDIPVVLITGPADGSTAPLGSSVTFSGTATDTEDGNLNNSLIWDSDIDGLIGTGASVSSTTLSAGTHVITAEAIDSGGLSGLAEISITITVTSPTLADTVQILNARYRSGKDGDLGELRVEAASSDPNVSLFTVTVTATGETIGTFSGGKRGKFFLAVNPVEITVTSSSGGSASIVLQ